MPTFLGRRVEVGLFDVDTDANVRDAFASPGRTFRIDVDEAALELLSDQLGFNADATMQEAEDYLAGRFRPKSVGFSGGSLGNFGEILTFLVRRNEGEDIERVDDATDDAGRRGYARPDFLAKTARGLRGIEVKSTESLDYQEMLKLSLRDETERGYRQLKPCRSVRGLRDEALRQLGFTDDPTGTHLVLRDGEVLPFPLREGIAIGVLVRDGRVDAFVPNIVRFKTPPDCRDHPSGRNCWLCVSTETTQTTIVMVEMPNKPDHLPILDDGGRGEPWFAAYRNWQQALWAHLPRTAVTAGAALLQATADWLRLSGAGDDRARGVEQHWRRTLVATARRRGIGLGETADGALIDQDVEAFGVEQVTSIPLQNAARAIGDTLEDTHPRRFAIEPAGDAGRAGILVSEGRLDVAALSSEWPSRGVREEQAGELATRVLALVAKLAGVTLEPADVSLRMTPVSARVNGAEIHLGWITDDASFWFWRFRRFGPRWWFPDPWRVPRLWVFPDGRVRFRGPRPHPGP